MAATRSARLELRVTPAQKEIIEHGAAVGGKTVTEYAVEVLTRAAMRDSSARGTVESSLGWMRGTATIVGDIVGPAEPNGWEAREFPE